MVNVLKVVLVGFLAAMYGLSGLSRRYPQMRWLRAFRWQPKLTEAQRTARRRRATFFSGIELILMGLCLPIAYLILTLMTWGDLSRLSLVLAGLASVVLIVLGCFAIAQSRRRPSSPAPTEQRRSTGAAVVVFDAEHRLLLIRENYGHRRWGLPGGASEPGETSGETAIREALEETGVAVAVGIRVGTYVIAIDPPHEVVVYLASIRAGTPSVPPTGEIAEVGWFAPDAIPEPTTNILPAVLDDLHHQTFGEHRIVQGRYP